MTPATRSRVLLVEADPGVRETIRTHLDDRYDVEEAGSAEEVLDRLRRQRLRYTVAITDVHLPGMSGVELSRLLLATHPLSPVVLITGDPDEALAREALGLGASGYLLKPFELFELDATVTQAVAMYDLVETTETEKVFTQLNYDLTERTTLHVEALYSYVDLPEWKTSPSYPPPAPTNPDTARRPCAGPGAAACRAARPPRVRRH